VRRFWIQTSQKSLFGAFCSTPFSESAAILPRQIVEISSLVFSRKASFICFRGKNSGRFRGLCLLKGFLSLCLPRCEAFGAFSVSSRLFARFRQGSGVKRQII